MTPHKQLFTLGILLLGSSAYAQTWIGMARAQQEGELVSVKGIALNGPELGPIRYIQDETGAIALYPGAGSVPGLELVKEGDEVLVSGALDTYQGLLEMSPVLSLEILSTGNPLPEPQTIFPAGFNEQRESEHIRLQCVAFENSGSFEAGQTYTLEHYDGIGFNLYIPEGHPLVGQAIPEQPVELSGILSRFNGYRVLVRDMDDLAASPCLYFEGEILPAALETGSISLNWETNKPCSCRVLYGTETSLENELDIPGQFTSHSAVLENLTPATAYYLRAQCNSNGFELLSPVRIYSTASNSPGQIEVYFNQSTDPVFSSGTFPSGNSWPEAEAAILERIDQAVYTIDVAVYNANLDHWIDALVEAHERGVQVRYIFEDQASNSALSGSLPFPILEGNTVELMHNKFLSIDAADPAKAFLVTASMNWTESGLEDDFNNVLIFQDQAMAKAYRTEFEEMWGSSGPQPDLAKARFGPAKLDNTPSFLSIGGRIVELYFTPSDRIVPLLAERLHSADHDVQFGLFILTMDELSAALKDLWFEGLDVRGIIEERYISGSDFDFLLGQGVPVQEHEPYGLFHHKYALVDATAPDSNPMVITGSYNWTNTATTANDENVIILHDADIANQFLQEFEARWSELVSVGDRAGEGSPFRIFPNPNSGEFWVEYRGIPVDDGLVRIWDSGGRLVGEFDSLAPGLYVVSLILPGGQVFLGKMVVE